ncbi:MAG: MBL fold metallo-hydrolase [Gemmatimonadota bacterium]|nr:MBL fold metallo-hydrolase [Gemmatimonadota bacterium]MDE3171925.1 MBL fold metallo-hydrolase [Gemmatimonadota bacterium]
MSLRLQFWGTRGSIPSPGPQTVRYGGNTPSVEVRTTDGWLIILDAGTGLRELGRSLLARANGAPITGDIFLTHAHWDHIQGIPFFAPIFHRGNHFTIWGAKTLETSIDRVVRDQMSPVVFPVTFEELDARIDFSEIAQDPETRNGFRVSAYPVRHPGGALGYRFAETAPGSPAFVYVSDNELGTGGKYDTPDGWRAGLVEFVRGATVLVHDTTYTTEEYEQYRGWGHSTYADAVGLALEAGVERLVLFHHKPERSDDELDRRVDECRAMVRDRGARLDVVAAAEGMTLTV